MKKSTLFTFISFILAVVSWGCLYFFPNFYLLLFAYAFTALFVCFLSVSIVSAIAARTGKSISSYKVFGIVDLLILLFFLGIALWDIYLSNEFFSGLLGIILFFSIIPATALFFIIDVCVYFIRRRKKWLRFVCRKTRRV